MTNKDLTSDLIEIIPIAMRAIRSEMRGLALPELSVAQFRILSRLAREPQSNKQIAEWVGISTAAMSRTIEVLVSRHLVQRKREALKDRREVVLCLTSAGKRKYEDIKFATKLKLKHRVVKLSVTEQRKLQAALKILSELFNDK